MYQENLSATLLDNNGRLSIGDWKMHIGVRYFLIKDQIAMGGSEGEIFPDRKNASQSLQ